MGRLFPILIGFLSNFFEFVAGFFPKQTLKGFIICEFDGTLFLSGSLLTSTHSGDLPC